MPSAAWRCWATLRGPDLELGGKLLAQRGGQVGHFVEAGGPLLEEPLPHLSRPIGRQPVLDEPVAELGGSLFEDGSHKAAGARACYMAKIPATGEVKPGNRSPPAMYRRK